MMPVDGRRGADTGLDDLPEDLVTDKILMLLPPKDVGRCRAVRASWRSATSTPEFMFAHHRRQPSFPMVKFAVRLGTFRASRRGRASYHPHLPPGHHVKLHASGDGFLIVSVSCRFYICNPTLHQLAPLPQPEFHHRNTILGLYRHDATGEYRVLWYSLVDGGCDVDGKMLHVITVGHSQSRKIRAASSPLEEKALLEALPGDSYSAYNPPVRHRGNLHWMSSGEIIVFDTATELFRRMRAATNSYSLFDVQGKLGLYTPDKRYTYMDVWVIEDYEAEMWEFKYRIDMSSIEACNSLHLTCPKQEKRKRTSVRVNPMSRMIHEISMLNEHELLFGYNDNHMLRCNIDGKLLGRANMAKRIYNLELTRHRLKECIIPIPSSKMQEEG
ncbi:F-box protein At5g18160 [Lolium perenne]|uniref:F-box protein At5g18160 n=1 Tax=Lolium perenne TaxID=4522 RepID=UPI0021EABCE8|nr:F-box protein At5g18160-like [Lolium perenne]